MNFEEKQFSPYMMPISANQGIHHGSNQGTSQTSFLSSQTYETHLFFGISFRNIKHHHHGILYFVVIVLYIDGPSVQNSLVDFYFIWLVHHTSQQDFKIL